MGKTSHIHSHEKSKVRECGYPQPKVDFFFCQTLFVMFNDGSSPKIWALVEARALNVGLRLGPGFNPSEKVDPEPWHGVNFYSKKLLISRPVSIGQAWASIEPGYFSKCQAQALPINWGSSSLIMFKLLVCLLGGCRKQLNLSWDSAWWSLTNILGWGL